jgi:hypothetical protein
MSASIGPQYTGVLVGSNGPAGCRDVATATQWPPATRTRFGTME